MFEDLEDAVLQLPDWDIQWDTVDGNGQPIM